MRRALVLVLLVLGAGTALAERVPTFPVSRDAQDATHVIVARKIGDGGAIVVEESLKGDLKPGDKRTVPFLAIFDDSKERKVIHPTWAGERGTTLTGDRMYVFLRRSASGDWNPSSPGNTAALASRPSFVWVEKDRVFGHQRGSGYATPIPGAVRVEYLHFHGTDTEPVDEAVLRKAISETIAATTSLVLVKAIPDQTKRAEALSGLLREEPDDAVFEALVGCGKYAVPVLDRLLADEKRAKLHFAAVHSLADIGDPSIDAVLVKVVERETAFLQSLPRGAERDEKASAHQVTTLVVLRTLQARKPAVCRDPVRKLREQLVAAALRETSLDSKGLTVECDGVLEALGE